MPARLMAFRMLIEEDLAKPAMQVSIRERAVCQDATGIPGAGGAGSLLLMIVMDRQIFLFFRIAL